MRTLNLLPLSLLAAFALLVAGCPGSDDDDDVSDDDSAAGDDDTAADDDDTTADDDDSATTDDDDTVSDDDDDTGTSSVSATVAYSECLGGGQPNPTPTLTDQGGGTLLIHLADWELNCCLEMVVASTSYDGTAVVVTLNDIGEPCDCLCGFDVDVTVEGLPAGEVMVVVQFGGSPVVNESVEMG
jgi:hypothetical protein